MTNLFVKSKWVWDKDYIDTINIYLDFYDTFDLTEIPYKCDFNISIDNQYVLYVNGEFADYAQYPDYCYYKVYETCDITKHLKVGKNEIRIIGYCQNENSSTYVKSTPGLIYSVTCGDNIILASGETTKVALNTQYSYKGVAQYTGQLSYSFKYTAGEPNTDHKCADVISKPMELFPRPIKDIVTKENKEAKLIALGKFKEDPDNEKWGRLIQYATMAYMYLPQKLNLPSVEGYDFAIEKDPNFDGIYTVIDLGEEDTGLVSLDFEVPEDTTVCIGYGEHLEDLRVRTDINPRNFVCIYNAKAGRNTFVHYFKRIGLRYMQVHFYSNSLKLYYAGIKPTHYPVSNLPYFKCADHLHNKIYDVCVRTLLLCMHEHYEDCPWREQALYSMDSRNQMLCGYYTFGEFEFAKSSLRLLGLAKNPDNTLDLNAPASTGLVIPSFNLVYIRQLYEYLLYSTDVEFIKEMIGTATDVLGFYLKELDKEKNLIKRLPDGRIWNFYEWAPYLDGPLPEEISGGSAVYDATLNAFLSMACDAMSNMHRILGNDKEASKYKEIAEKISTAINSNFWSEENKCYASYLNDKGELHIYTELTQSLIVYVGACPDDRIDDTLCALASGKLITVTLSHSIYKYEALLSAPDKYVDFVFDDIAKLWGYMLYNGATTFWETIDGAPAFWNAGSLCHGWTAIPSYLYFRYILGLKVSDDGKATYTVEPVKSKIYEAKGKIITPNEIIEI